MYCKNCGKELSDGASFCVYCGEKTSLGKLKADNDVKKNVEARAEYASDSQVASKGFAKEIAKYFFGLLMYLIGLCCCVVYYKAMLSFENMLLSYFDMDNEYWIAFGLSFLCVLVGIFMMLGNSVEAKTVFASAWVVSILSCIIFGAFFVWMIVYAVPYIGL